MSEANPDPRAALNDFLAQAADELALSADNPLSSDTEGLLFLGAWHQSYPAIVVRDPFLSDSAKVQFLYLMQESAQKPHGAIPMPSLDETARILGQSRRTVIRDRTLLRVCRWISVCRTVRDRLGRFRGSIYAIHSEPCTLAEGSRLDDTYLNLLNQSNTHRDPYLRYAAQAALGGIDQTLDEGRDPLDPPDTINRRLHAAAAVQNGSGSFFDLLLTREKAASANDDDKNGEAHAKSKASCPQHAKFALGQTGAHFAPGLGQPGANSAPGPAQPSAEFAPGTQVSDLSVKRETYPQDANFALGYSSSSSKTTTTEDKKQNKTLESHSSVDALVWPPQLDGSQRAVIDRAMSREQIPEARRQQVVDVLAHKMLDADNPLRSPAGYAIKLCQRIKSGQFQPVAPPVSTAPENGHKQSGETNDTDLELREVRVEMRRLRSEVNGLERDLIPLADPESRPRLEASRDRYRAQLNELSQRYRALRENTRGEETSTGKTRIAGQ